MGRFTTTMYGVPSKKLLFNNIITELLTTGGPCTNPLACLYP